MPSNLEIPMTQKPYMRCLLMLAVVIGPLILTLILTKFQSGSNLNDYVPVSSDEKMYWHQISSFITAGYDNGYYTRNEVPGKMSFSHYYTKGPVFPTLYGILGKIFGWETYTGAYFNIVLLSLATLFYVSILKPDTRQLLILLVFLITFWPLLLFTNKITQEAIVDAVAIATSGMLVIVLRRQGNLSWRAKMSIATFIIGASLIRGSTWVILLPALFLISARRKTLFPLIVQGVIGVGLASLGYWIFAQFLSPTSNLGSSLPTSRTGIRLTIERAIGNFGLFHQGRLIWLVQRYQMVLVSVVSAIPIITGLWQNRRSLNTFFVERDSWFWEAVLHLTNLGGIISLNILFYDMFDWRDYRVFHPHLLLSVLLLIAFRRYKWAFVIVLTNMMFLLPFEGNFFTNWHDVNHQNYTYQTGQHPELSAQLQLLEYDETQDSEWCNTLLLVPLDILFHIDVRDVPAGIGISLIGNEYDLTTKPIKSYYLLIWPENAPIVEKEHQLEFIADTEIGQLYRNLDADCE